MAYSTIDSPKKYFEAKTYTGTGSTQSISGLSFSPDFVWIKQRSGVTWHNLYDVLRGTTKALASNDTGGDDTRASGLTAFTSDGFTLGTDNNANGSSNTYISWCWDANGAGVSNTAGTISSTVSANTTAGFSIVSYTGNGTSGATVGHGLGVAPKMIIRKVRSTIDAWCVYHSSIGNTGAVFLNNTNATSTGSGYNNNTSPTSTVFSNGNDTMVNSNGATYIAYCFAEVKGFSKFGSYTGNASADGTFVYTGFKPAFIIVKNTTTAGNSWAMFDNKRLGYNVSNLALFPSDSSSETSGTSYIDILSNGFKMRSINDFNNKSGDTYIYMCFAENPFVSSKGIPTTAR
jgi:hypothetical protein